ncbi:MAG: hypothetical protein AAFV85_18190 [Cyanobacteria bacterium J06634_6]
MNSEESTPFLPEKEYLEAKYAPWLGITALLLGLLNVVLAVGVILLSGEFSTTIVTGILLTIVGILYLTRIYFVVAPNRITLYNLLGSAVKRYVYASPTELRLEGSTIYIETETDSKPQKIKVAKWMTKSADWKQLESMILSR